MGLTRGAIELGVQALKEMWDHLCKIHVTQHQGINVHYYYQDLSMSDYIGTSLSLCHRIIKASQKIEDTHIVHVILLSVSHTGIWDLIKQNHLDKGNGLTLDMVTAELIAVHDLAEWNQVTNKA